MKNNAIKKIWSPLVYTKVGQTILITGQISLRYFIAGHKYFFGLLFFKYDIIDVNFGYFSYINVS